MRTESVSAGRADFHCRGKIGRRDAGNNELSVVFSLNRQLYCLYTRQHRRTQNRALILDGSLPTRNLRFFCNAPCYLAATRCPGHAKEKVFGPVGMSRAAASYERPGKCSAASLRAHHDPRGVADGRMVEAPDDGIENCASRDQGSSTAAYPSIGSVSGAWRRR
jgi:hypothetical protein